VQRRQIPLHSSFCVEEGQTKREIFSKRIFGCRKDSKNEKETAFYGTLTEISESPAYKGTEAFI